MRKEIFRADNVTCSVGGVNLLDNFNLHVFEGEILGLFFADNHGKDEFVTLATENLAIDYGRIFYKDEQVNSYRTIRAGLPQPARIGYVSRAGGLIDDMTVAENVFVMRKGFRKYIISKPVLISQFAALAAEYGVDVDGGVYVRDLSPADRYVIQALKAVTSGCALVIIRNAGLQYGGAELTAFQQQVRRFAERGVSFIYISSDINVLTGACDRIAVAEGGRVIRVVDRPEFTSKKLSRYHYAPDSLFPSPGTDLVSVLRFDKVKSGAISMLDFSVAKWECVLLWDRVDRIRDEIRRLLTRETRPASGEIRILGMPFARARADVRISYIREAPTRSMIFSEMNYLDNLCIRAAERIPSLWLKNSGRKIIRDEYRAFVGGDIDEDSPADLSAESLYNLVYLREYIYNPQLLVIERPFLETDIRIRMHIISLIAKFKARGAAVLIIDSSMTGAEAVSDRMLIAGSGGRITGERKFGGVKE